LRRSDQPFKKRSWAKHDEAPALFETTSTLSALKGGMGWEASRGFSLFLGLPQD